MSRTRQNRLVEVKDQIAKVGLVPDEKYSSTLGTDRLAAHFGNNVIGTKI